MKNFKKELLLALFSIVIISCSKDDGPIVTTVTTANLTKNIDENSGNGAVIGTVTGASNTGTVNFSITSQIPNGALAINTTTGELTVADTAIFDFETNPTITAIVSVADGEVTNNSNVTVNLNDIDDIEFLLSESKKGYSNAANGEWILVTEAEYNTLATKLNNVSITGTTEAEFNSSSASYKGVFGEFTTATINTATTMPTGGYLFAFKYEVDPQNDEVTTAQVKQSSTSNYSGFADIGGELPSHSHGSEKTFYFVLKGNSTATTNTGYIAFSKGKDSRTTHKIIGGAQYHYADGNTNNLGPAIFMGTNGIRWMNQGLVTTQKQW